MTVAEIEAIVGGYHGDPFRILGPHRIEKPRGTPSWEVRAFLPQAESAEVILADENVAMEGQHPQVCCVPRREADPRLYGLRAKLAGGKTVDCEDPSRFPPLLSEFDLH